jgi:DivIVA domain-containing protein
MSTERGLLRIGEYLIARAARRLPPGMRDERYREWVAELPAILRDPDTRLPARRAARMLGYALGTIRGTIVTRANARRLMGKLATTAIGLIAYSLVEYFLGWAKTPQEYLYRGIGFVLGFLAISGCGLAFRRWRGKRPEKALDARARTFEQRAQARAMARADGVLQARASARPVAGLAAPAAGSFPRRKLGPGYRPAQVDEFIARIEATLSGHARPGQAVTAADVQAVKFKITRRGGYDELVLDEVLNRYADELNKPGPRSVTGPAAG